MTARHDQPHGFARPPRVRVRKDRAVAVTSVACPSCDAPIGSPCVTQNASGKRVQHEGRRRMALRAERQAAESARIRQMAQELADAAPPIPQATQDRIAALIQTSRHADAA